MGKIAKKSSQITDEMWLQVNDFNREITEEFLMESVSLSGETLKQYKSNLRIFFWWVKENINNKSILDIKSRDFLKYQNWLTRRDMSSSAIRLKRSAVSSLNDHIITYYEDEYPTFKNFITKKIVAPPKAFVHEKKPLNAEEYELLIKELEKREDWQKIAYMKFTYSTGCRLSETIQLLKEVIDYDIITKTKEIKNENNEKENKEIKYYMTHDIRCKGKGKIGKIRKLKFDEEAMDAIKKWLEIRGEDNYPYVFVSKYKGEMKQISKYTINKWNADIFSKIVGRRVHGHGLREKRATDIVVTFGKDISAAQALLGHAQSSTTEIYVIKDREEDADEAFI